MPEGTSRDQGNPVLRLALCGLAVVVAMFAGPVQAATVQYVYDELGRLVAEVDAGGEVTVYTYDAAGNLVSVSRNDANDLAIAAFTPSRGKVGDTVTIFGSGFVPTPTQNNVSFNGTPAAVQTASQSSLLVTVPSGASSGPIAVSNVNGSVVSAQAFTVSQPPVITAVTPGLVQRGTTLRLDISGANLTGATAVTFFQAGLVANLISGGTDTLLPVELTVAGSTPLGSHAFSVTANGDTGESGAVTVTVTAALLGDVLTATRPLSVHVPPVVVGATAGNRMIAGQALSVHLPAFVAGTAPGNALSTGQPLSIHLPAVVSGVPGNAVSVTQPVSVSVQ